MIPRQDFAAALSSAVLVSSLMATMPMFCLVRSPGS